VFKPRGGIFLDRNPTEITRAGLEDCLRSANMLATDRQSADFLLTVYLFNFGLSDLTVLTQSLVIRLTFEGKQTTGVEILHGGKIHRISAALELVLSCGAIQTPKLLMQSGIGDQQELQTFGIAPMEHLPGVGRNFQDHVGFDCVWESRKVFPQITV
jgi:choline dehydrogenase-like flavoprotein